MTGQRGYWHLLPVQSMRTKAPGDSKEMVAARRAFLNAGYYGIFGRALGNCALRTALPPGQMHRSICWMRAAARAGTTAALHRPLHRPRSVQLAGFDIAKPAVRLAAKALPAAKYAVASSFAQPVRTGWADLLLNCFSPFAQEEFRRVLRPGGRMIYVVPGAEHLYQMKAVLYDTPYKIRCRRWPMRASAPLGREVSGSITVPAGQLEALFAMTLLLENATGWRARLAALPELTTDIAFRFLVFERVIEKPRPVSSQAGGFAQKTGSHRDPAQCVGDRAGQDDSREDGAEIPEHKVEHRFAAEGLTFPCDLFLDLSTPTIRETSRQVAMAAMGIITELVRKSKKSRNCIPNTVTLAGAVAQRKGCPV